MTNFILRHRPPRITLMLLVLAAGAHFFIPGLDKVLYSSFALALPVGIAGFLFMMSGWWLFKKHKIAICPIDRTDRILHSGIYKVSRNPMYLGILLMMAGTALAMGSLPFYLVMLINYLILGRVFCPYEEAKLIRDFGLDYAHYLVSVPRWL